MAGGWRGRVVYCTELTYPSADVWASNPLVTSREFDPHRFHHQSSGAVAVGYNLCRIHEALKTTPADALGVVDSLSTLRSPRSPLGRCRARAGATQALHRNRRRAQMSLFPFSLCCARYFNLNGTNLPILFDRFLGLIGLLRVMLSRAKGISVCPSAILRPRLG